MCACVFMRQRQTHKHREADRQRHTDRETDRETDRHREADRDRQRERQRQTGRQRHTQRHTHTHRDRLSGPERHIGIGLNARSLRKRRVVFRTTVKVIM